MSTTTLIGDLADLARLTRAVQPGGEAITYESLHPRHREQLARLYQLCYPPHIGAADAAEALGEVDATFAGEYGSLILTASLVALRAGRVVGSIQVVHRSPWDPDLRCPFIIEFFVGPDSRGCGVGRALLARAAAACAQLGETRIALRTGEGTSPAATHLYRLAGLKSHATS